MKKKISIILVIVILITASVISYLLLKNNKKDDKGSNNNPTSNTIANVPEDWITYKDPLTGFKISYPNNWHISTTDPSQTPLYAGSITTKSFASIKKEDYIVEVTAHPYVQEKNLSGKVISAEEERISYKKINIDGKSFLITNYMNSTEIGPMDNIGPLYLKVYINDPFTNNNSVYTDYIIQNDYAFVIYIYIPNYIDSNYKLDTSKYDENIINEAIKIVETIKWGN